MKACKVVIPAAGLGTRFLPFTKAVPKEMLPIGHKPAIHYIAQEIMFSGFTDICFITSKNKNAIADYFDYSLALDHYLEQKKQQVLLSELDFLIQHLTFSYIRQAEPRGLGHAVQLAQNFIKEEFFAVVLPDDLIVSKTPALEQLKVIHDQFNCSVIAVKEVLPEQAHLYGIINIKALLDDNLYEIGGMVEKPLVNPPSHLAIIGRYILSTEIFDMFEEHANTGSEIQLTDAIAKLIARGHRVIAVNIEGDRYDLGNPVGWFKANEYIINKSL